VPNKTPLAILYQGRRPQVATLSPGAGKPDKQVMASTKYIRGKHRCQSQKVAYFKEMIHGRIN
jgi:hypothetical protein